MVDRAPGPRRGPARLLAAIPPLALLGGLAAGAAPAAAAPPPGINVDVLGLVQLAIPLTVGPGGNSVGTGVNMNVAGVVSLSTPLGATVGGAPLLSAPVGVHLDIPLLYALRLPLPPILLSVQRLLGGLPLQLGVLAPAFSPEAPGSVNVDVKADVG